MRVLLTGATGLIGRAVLAGLRGEGHEVIAVARSTASARLPKGVSCIALDIARATSPADWLSHLAGIDAVVNCAGVLQDSPRDSTAGVHVEGAGALFAACEQASVRRIVQVSAIGVERATADTAFARTKLAGDQVLMARDLAWVILRPSVVVGRAAYGGSALFRGLAALPVVPRVAGTGPLQVVQLDDLVRTVRYFLAPDAPTRIVLEIAGPERLSLADVLTAYRRWLGHSDALSIRVPAWMLHAACRVGDLLGLLGWRPPLRSTTRLELMHGAVGDPAPWMRVTGIVPRTLAAALAAEPACVQERWFAGLYFLKPLALATLALYWMVTGLVALGPGREDAAGLIHDAGFGAAGVLAAAGAIADIAIGVAIAVRRTAGPALYAALAVSIAYAMLGTLWLPWLWADPLGPLVKVLPITVLNLVALAILDDR